MNLFRRLLLCASLSLCFTQAAHAIMANPHPVTVTQPDGTELTIRLHGDESFHYTTTLDGFLIRQDKDGFYKYYDYSAQTLTKQVANNVELRSAAEIAIVSRMTPAKKLLPLMVQSREIIKKAPRTTTPRHTAHDGSSMRAAAQTTESRATISRYLLHFTKVTIFLIVSTLILLDCTKGGSSMQNFYQQFINVAISYMISVVAGIQPVT